MNTKTTLAQVLRFGLINQTLISIDGQPINSKIVNVAIDALTTQRGEILGTTLSFANHTNILIPFDQGCVLELQR